MPTRSSPLPGLPALPVLVVSPELDHVITIRRAARQWPVDAQIEWACGPQQAARRARELAAQLVVIDCSADRAGRAALLEALQVCEQPIEIMAFGDAMLPATGVWPWPALTRLHEQ